MAEARRLCYTSGVLRVLGGAMMMPYEKSRMPVSALAWLANLVFVAIPLLVCLLALSFVARPPKSAWDVLIESHKIILVAAVTLSGVTLIEGILLAVKMGTRHSRESVGLFIVCAIFLLISVAVSVPLFLAVLVYEANRTIAGEDETFAFVLQFIIGVWLLIIPIIVALKFKYLDSSLAEESEPGAAVVQPEIVP